MLDSLAGFTLIPMGGLRWVQRVPGLMAPPDPRAMSAIRNVFHRLRENFWDHLTVRVIFSHCLLRALRDARTLTLTGPYHKNPNPFSSFSDGSQGEPVGVESWDTQK